MNPVIHFEMPAADKERVKRFYESAFGWQMQVLGPEMGNYVLASTSETDEAGLPKSPGTINGGFYEKTEEYNVPSVVISVDDIHDAMKKVAVAGGTVLDLSTGKQVDEIPGIGLFASILDTEGNRVGMLQPAPMNQE